MRTRSLLHTTINPQQGKAITYLMTGVFLIGLMDADIKYLSHKFHIIQLTWSRFFFSNNCPFRGRPLGWVLGPSENSRAQAKFGQSISALGFQPMLFYCNPFHIARERQCHKLPIAFIDDGYFDPFSW